MPKPRTRWTGLKHFGTILWHPQQYYRYKTHRDAFVQTDHLNLHAAYAAEPGPGHPYPGAVGPNPSDTAVIYPPVGGPPAATLVGGPIQAHPVHDDQLAQGVNPAQLGADRDNLVTLRQEGGVTALRSAKKRGPHTDPLQPNVGRTQHTTLTGAAPVAAAALYDPVGPGLAPQPTLHIASGHYGPGHHAATKLAIYGKQTGTIDRRTVDFLDHTGAPLDMTMKQRMQIVSNWARTGLVQP